MKLGRILGFEISLDYSWFIVFALVVFTMMRGTNPHPFGAETPSPDLALAIAGSLVLFASVLAHELGHSVVGRRMGVQIEGITLFIFGGIARLKDEPRKPAVEFWMTVAGPFVSGVLAALFFAAGFYGLHNAWPPALVTVLGYLAVANESIAIFNLVPAFPLDGGRILRSALWAWKKDIVKATQWAGRTSRVIAFLLIAFGAVEMVLGNLFGMWEVFIGLFIISAANSAYEQVVLRKKLEGVTVASLTQGARPVPANLTLNWVLDDYVLTSDQVALAVMDGDTLRGILTLDAIRAVPVQQWPWTMAIEVAEPVQDEAEIEDNADAWQALTKMLAAHARHLLVMHDGHIQGVLTQDQMLEYLNSKGLGGHQPSVVGHR